MEFQETRNSDLLDALEGHSETSDLLKGFIRNNGVHVGTDMNRFGLNLQLDVLSRELLPKLLVTYGVGLYKPFRLWCMECPHVALPLEFLKVLVRFQQNFPDFKFHILVTDSCPDRIASARNLFRECYFDTSLETCLSFRQLPPIRATLSTRTPQDAIVCYADLAVMDEPCRNDLLLNFARLLFPGRALMGPLLEPALIDESAFEIIRRGVYRRLP